MPRIVENPVIFVIVDAVDGHQPALRPGMALQVSDNVDLAGAEILLEPNVDARDDKRPKRADWETYLTFLVKWTIEGSDGMIEPHPLDLAMDGKDFEDALDNIRFDIKGV